MVSIDSEMWAATRVVAMHAGEGRCGQCEQDGCRLLTWADVRLKAWEAEHRERYPWLPAWEQVDPRPAHPTRRHDPP